MGMLSSSMHVHKLKLSSLHNLLPGQISVCSHSFQESS